MSSVSLIGRSPPLSHDLGPSESQNRQQLWSRHYDWDHFVLAMVVINQTVVNMRTSELDDKFNLRQTLLEVDTKEFYDPGETYESDFLTEFLDPSVLSKLFSPSITSTSTRLGELRSNGGLVSIMNGLKVWHEVGLTRFSSYLRRETLFGSNSDDPSASKKVLKKLAAVLRDGIIGWFILLWILQIICEYVLGQWTEPWTMVLNVVMMAVLVQIRFKVRNYLDSNIYKSIDYSQSWDWVTVRREGRVVKIQEEKLLVGDILLFSSDDSINVDGVIVKNHGNLQVDEYKTITQKFNVIKTNGWDLDDSADPFIYAGTEVVYGKGELLVCCVGEQCTFRAVTRTADYLKNKTKYVREGQGKNILLVKRFAQIVILAVIYIKMMAFLIRLSPLLWYDIPIIIGKLVDLMAWYLIIQNMQRIDYLYCFIENRTYQHKDFKILNKRVLEQLLKLDVLLIEQGLLDVHDQHNTRQDRQMLIMHKAHVLSELNGAVDLKIVTNRSIDKCKECQLRNPYAISRGVNDQLEINNLQRAKFICHIDPSYYTSYLVKVFKALDYRIGVVPQNLHDNLQGNPLVISTDDSQKGVQDMSWVKLNSPYCEDGLKKLYLISTSFYILLNGIMNHSFLSLFTVLGGILFVDLPVYAVVLLAVMEIAVLHVIYQLISQYNCTNIETGQSFENNFIAHHVTFVPFFLYSIYKIEQPWNVFLFLICRDLTSVVYNTRMGALVRDGLRFRFFAVVYSAIVGIMSANVGIAYLFGEEVREEVSLVIIVLFMNLIYLAERNYNNPMSANPENSFN